MLLLTRYKYLLKIYTDMWMPRIVPPGCFRLTHRTICIYKSYSFGKTLLETADMEIE